MAEKGVGRVHAALGPHVPVSLLLRGVKKEDKPLAVGIQFMLLRVLGKEPGWALCGGDGGPAARCAPDRGLSGSWSLTWG